MRAEYLRIGNYYNQFGNIQQVSWVTLKELENAPALKDVDKAIWEYDRLLDEFHEAKQRVIFESCELIKEHQYSWVIRHDNQNYIFHKNFTIEDLIDLNITITEKAINQFKLR